MIEEQLAHLQLQVDLLIQEVARLRGSSGTRLTILENHGIVLGADQEEADSFPPGRNTPPGANLTNSVTAGGTAGVIADITDQIVYANDAAAIRNNIYQLARLVKLDV